MKDLRVKDLRFELKQVTEAGEFEGYGAVYGVRDDNGDIIETGAFTRTLQHRKGKVPLLWQHALNEPIGIAEAAETPYGLRVVGKLNLEVARAREIHALMRQSLAEGVPFGLSFGFDTLKALWKGNTRHVSEVRLWEISPTLFPAQSLAVVSTVKQAQPSEGKPFGDYDDMDHCVRENQDKENPEGYCAWLHHEIVGEWPAASKAWTARVADLFARMPEIRLTREQVATMCPPCAQKMEKKGIATLILSPESVKQIPEELLQGLCDYIGGDPGFFMSCMEASLGDFGPADKESFCAWLHEQCTGIWPGEHRSIIAGARYALIEVIGTALQTASESKEAIGYIRQAADALAVLQQATSGKFHVAAGLDRSDSDSVFHSLWALMREMRADARGRLMA